MSTIFSPDELSSNSRRTIQFFRHIDENYLGFMFDKVNHRGNYYNKNIRFHKNIKK